MENDYESIKHHAMIVLENVRKGKIGKLKFEHNIPPHIVNFLKNNNLIFFEKVDKKSENQVVLITEKGREELKEIFKYK